MSIPERRAEILSLINTRREMTVDSLVQAFGVSAETIRRDLAALQKDRQLRKFHGGARSLALPDPSLSESPYPQRLIQNVTAKHAIGAALARDLRPGDSLFMDAGTTTLIAADHIARCERLTVITNAPSIAARVATNPAHQVYLLGGAYHAEVGENLGPLVIDQINRFRTTYAVLTIGAIGPDSAMDFDEREADVARAMVNRAGQLLVLADAAKLGRTAVFDVAPLPAITSLYTSAMPDAALAQSLNAARVHVVIG